jgi:hypothetical protein
MNTSQQTRSSASGAAPCSACRGNGVWSHGVCLDCAGTGLQSQIADITKRAGEIESLRSEFESWISASPFEREIERWPNDESKHAWPGQYRDINVALAWEAWQEAAFIHSLPNTLLSRRPEEPLSATEG